MILTGGIRGTDVVLAVVVGVLNEHEVTTVDADNAVLVPPCLEAQRVQRNLHLGARLHETAALRLVVRSTADDPIEREEHILRLHTTIIQQL